MVETVTSTESIPERLVSQWLERKSCLNDLFCLVNTIVIVNHHVEPTFPICPNPSLQV